MPVTSLPESYEFCHRVMRTQARNFYFGMRLLPPAKRQAMHALYTFMRQIDDLADNDNSADRRSALEHFRSMAHQALDGHCPSGELWPALADTVQRFRIGAKIFDDAIDGQIQDLTQNTYATFDELYQYCYRVASTVGIAALHIWGYHEPQAVKLAEYRGIAMQLTNILRDLREDAGRGRIYLPAEDLRRFGCDCWDKFPKQVPDRFEELMAFECKRAMEYYVKSAPLDGMVDADSRSTLEIMTTIYRGILERIMAKPSRVLYGRVSLSALRKYSLVLRYAWKKPVKA